MFSNTVAEEYWSSSEFNPPDGTVGYGFGFGFDDGLYGPSLKTYEYCVMCVRSGVIDNIPPVLLTWGLTELTFTVYATSIPENSVDVYNFDTLDGDGDPVTYEISGTDSVLFEINATTGILRFINPPDYENPEDNNEDNSYAVYVYVSDGKAEDFIDLRTNVTDVDENSVSKNKVVVIPLF